MSVSLDKNNHAEESVEPVAPAVNKGGVRYRACERLHREARRILDEALSC